jgi:hypothetical protein
MRVHSRVSRTLRVPSPTQDSHLNRKEEKREEGKKKKRDVSFSRRLKKKRTVVVAVGDLGEVGTSPDWLMRCK